MSNMTRNDLVEAIETLNMELAREISEKGQTKRATFLQATINLYSKKLAE